MPASADIASAVGADNGKRMLQRFELAAKLVDFFEGHG
jgi:hypothetical protein